jgi:N-acyl homoserine lactone hydrolase
VSGLPDWKGVPVWLNAAERKFIDSGVIAARVAHSFGSLRFEIYEFEGGPYLGFPRHHDVFADGSIVLVPAPGHTPGSIVAFVTLPSGARYALLGDLVWQREGIELPAERPWLSRRLADLDAGGVAENIERVAAIHARFPDLHLLPAHDARAFARLPVFPQVTR